MPGRDRAHCAGACEAIRLSRGEVLEEPGERVRHVYFPIAGFVSLTTEAGDDCPSLEVGLVGNEGMLGSSLILGVELSPFRARVRGEGSALRMEAAEFVAEIERNPALEEVLRRYLHAWTGHLARMSACIRFHVVEKRLARWLLMAHDRAQSNGFHVTHEFIAAMLGVRRVGITKAATSLQKRQLIRYHRGDITIVDRCGLEAASCGCYAADRAMYARTIADGSRRHE